MDKKIVRKNDVSIAVVYSDEIIITDAQSALDLIMTIQHYDNYHRIAINKQAILEDFFVLSTGIAGEILQKLVNYRKKIAIIGDFSVYTRRTFQSLCKPPE